MKRYLSMILMGALIALAGCDPNQLTPEPEKPACEVDPSDVQVAATVSTLAFSWKAIENVYQYTYTLYRDDSPVNQGVTKKLGVTFSNLVPSTRYSLEVTAFLNSGPATRLFVSSASTADVVKLGSPSSMIVENGGGIITLKWDAVEHADSYSYLISGEGVSQSGSTTANEVVVSGFAKGDYTISIVADSADEAFSASDEAVFAFAVSRKVVESKTGTFSHYVYDGDDAVLSISNECTLDIWDDDTYTIRNFMGAEGYDLEFSLNDDGTFNFLNATDYYSYKLLYTGIDNPSSLMAYIADGYYGYELDDEEDGSYIYFGSYDSGNAWCYDEFQWDMPGEDEEGAVYYRGYDSNSGDSQYEYACKLEVKEDGTLVFKSFYGVAGYDLELKFDDNGKVKVINAYNTSGGYKYVYTGLASPYDYIMIYESYLDGTLDDPDYGNFIYIYYYDVAGVWSTDLVMW